MERDLHLCYGAEYKEKREQWICSEDQEGVLSYWNAFDDNMTYSIVNFCPFCSFKSKDKKIDYISNDMGLE